MSNIADQLKAFGDAAEAIKKIENQTKESNFDWSLLFPSKKKLHLGWLISSIAVFVIICISAIFAGSDDQKIYLVLFICGLLSAGWVACCTHLRFEKITLTGGVSFVLIIALLVSGRVLTPAEGANKVLDQITDKGGKAKEIEKGASK